MSEIKNIEKLMNDKAVEFRDFKIDKIETRENSGVEEMIIEGIPCVFNQETVLYKTKYYEAREIIDSKAFDAADMTDVIFNYNHCGRVFARTRNKSLDLSVETDGLHMKAILMQGDEGHAQLYRDIKSGLIDKMSFAFKVKASEFKYIDREDDATVEIRKITEIEKLYDVSAVDIPAYDSTTISARNAFDAEREKRTMENDKRAQVCLKIKLELEGEE